MLLQSFIALGFASLELHHLQEAFETMGGRPGAEAWPAPDPKTPRHPTFGNSKVVRTVRFLRLLRLLSMFEQLIAIVWIPFFEIAQCQAAPWQTEGPLRRLWGMLQSCKDEIFCPDGHIQILVGACWIVWNFFGRSEVTRSQVRAKSLNGQLILPWSAWSLTPGQVVEQCVRELFPGHACDKRLKLNPERCWIFLAAHVFSC